MGKRGLFITLEGPEGAGKSTQCALLTAALRARGHEVWATREPGGTPLGEELRRLIKHFGAPGSVSAEAELLMFGASRAQLMREEIMPRLASGTMVVCDRFADSTTVYQGYARGLDMRFIEAMHDLTLAGCWPDLTLLFDLEPETGFMRSYQRNGTTDPGDRIEAEPLDFHHAVRAGFLELAARHADRIQCIHADAEPQAIHADVMEIVDRVLE